MWELDVFSTGKHFMVTALHPCPDYPNLHHLVHLEAAVAAAAARNQQRRRIPQSFTAMPKGKISMQPSLISRKLRVSSSALTSLQVATNTLFSHVYISELLVIKLGYISRL